MLLCLWVSQQQKNTVILKFIDNTNIYIYDTLLGH